ncbi:MAG: ATP-binding cassette domain-containing protein [Chitinophagales bacterium]
MVDPFLSVENLSVRLSGSPVLEDISFVIRPKEQWALLGPSGSGKTVLAHTLAGRHFYHGRISVPRDDLESFQKNVFVVEQQHRFKDLRNQSDFYYQQRYNSFDASGTITAAEDLKAYRESAAGTFHPDDLIDLFQIRNLLTEPLIQLSNGENKRLQIVKALLTDHALLILDQPFTGLDATGRKQLSEILDHLSLQGEQMILITSARDIPSCITQFTILREGRIIRTGKTADLAVAGNDSLKGPDKRFPSAITFPHPGFEYAVRMIDVNIRYEEKSILREIHWEVKKGSCWSLSGPNGAGKTTLLSLITGDNPQAYANEIYLFDRRRGTGESIWEIKRKTGFLSPELHLYFDRGATAYQALASGIWDTIGLFRQLSDQQHELVWEWLDFLDLLPHHNRLLSSLPAGIQRMVLLGRAMIKTPPLLVLDEPCQGLDVENIERVKNLISRYCKNYLGTLIYVSHYSEELPDCVDHFLRLEQGAIV